MTAQVLRDLEREAELMPPNRVEVLNLVKEDMLARNELGIKTYGTELMTHNGRDALLDAYRELLDAVKYYTQYLMERGTTMDLNYGLLLDTLCRIRSVQRAGPVSEH